MLRTVGLEVLGSESASGLDKEAAAARTKGRESVREKEEWANSPSITRTRTHTHVLSPICSIVHALYSTLPSHHTHTYTHASKNSIQECTSSYEQVKIILGFVLLKKRVPREDIGLRRWAHTHARTFTHPLSLSHSIIHPRTRTNTLAAHKLVKGRSRPVCKQCLMEFKTYPQ